MKRSWRQLLPWWGWALLAGVGLLVSAWGYFFLGPRLAPYVSIVRARIKYAISPPQQAVFVPQDQVAPIVQATLRAYTATAQALTPTVTPTPTPTEGQ